VGAEKEEISRHDIERSSLHGSPCPRR
jgi:hypothetical protein